ncbi:MAG: hypothetical protein CMJ31_09975 [Phycisphaerae bacterium]|nr:hypothetical protein [Phycisphaerae bacterium]
MHRIVLGLTTATVVLSGCATSHAAMTEASTTREVAADYGSMLAEAVRTAKPIVIEMLESDEIDHVEPQGYTVLSDDAFAERIAVDLITRTPDRPEDDGARIVVDQAMERGLEETGERLTYFSPTTGWVAVRASGMEELAADAKAAGIAFEQALIPYGAIVYADAGQSSLVEPVGLTRRHLLDDERFDIIRGLGDGISAYTARRTARDAGGDELADFFATRLEQNRENTAGDRRVQGLRYVDGIVSTTDIGEEMKTVWNAFFNPPEKLDPAYAPGSGASVFKRPLSAVEPLLPGDNWKWLERKEPPDSPRALLVAINRPIRLVTQPDQDRLRVDLTDAEYFGWIDSTVTPSRVLTISVLRYENEQAAITARPALSGALNGAFARLTQGVAQEDRQSPRALNVDGHNLITQANVHDARGTPRSSAVAAGRIGDSLVIISLYGDPDDYLVADDLLPEVVRRIASISASADEDSDN